MTKRPLKMEAVHCGVCHSDDWRPFAKGKDYEYHTSDDEFNMVECTSCSNVYLNPRPVKDELSTIYPPNYYAYNYDSSINALALKAKDFLDTRKIHSWLSHVSNPKTVRFLDVGCGNGRYLKMLHKLGVPKENLFGVEMSEEAIAGLNQEGYRGYYGRIEDVFEKLPKGSFDLIVILQVLEHVEDPSVVVKQLGQLLAPGGVLIVETPNTKSLDVAIFRQSYWGGYHFPRHWNLFSKETLTRMALESHLKVKEFNFLPAHTFWIFSFQHMIAERTKSAWLKEFFNPFQNVVLLSLATGFDIVRAKVGFATSNIQLVATKP